MKNPDDILKKILLNMKYDSKMSLKENYNLLLNEQKTYYDKTDNKIHIDYNNNERYVWDPKNGWFIVNNDNTLTSLDDNELLKKLRSVFKNSGIGLNYYIKNKEQGDKFRRWVISKDPSFAKSINLSPSGEYNNNYIYKAWSKYGENYKEFLKSKSPSSVNLTKLKEDLKSKGFEVKGNNQNQVYAYAALTATKKLNDRISKNMGGKNFTKHSVCVTKVGSTCPPDTYLNFNTFDLNMAKKINQVTDTDPKSKGWKPTQYTFLTNFYFDWGKIIEDYQKTFKNDSNAYKSELFPDGWWNWFTQYWGTDDLNEITIHPEPQNVNVTTKNKYEHKFSLWDLNDAHETTSLVELGTLLLGLIPSPLSPFLLGVSTAAGLTDASLYYAQGDKYMGTMMLALEIIPGGEFIDAFKSVGRYGKITKLGKEGTKEIIEKGIKNELRDETEKRLYKEVTSELKQGADQVISKEVKNQIAKNISTKLLDNFKKMGGDLNSFFEIIPVVWKILGKIPQTFIKVGGTAWTIDQLYLALYGRDEDRQNSDIRTLYYLLKTGNKPDIKDLENAIKKFQDEIMKSPEKTKELLSGEKGLQIGNDKDKIDIRDYYTNRYYNTQSKIKNVKTNIPVQTPTIQSVENGMDFITYGMSGNSITEIKKLLKSNWELDLNSDKLNKTLNNNLYDDDLYDLIVEFQNKIIPKYFNKTINPPEEGVIDKETLNFLKQSRVGKLDVKKFNPLYPNQGKIGGKPKR
jgi:predicted DNA-binding protein